MMKILVLFVGGGGGGEGGGDFRDKILTGWETDVMI